MKNDLEGPDNICPLYYSLQRSFPCEKNPFVLLDGHRKNSLSSENVGKGVLEQVCLHTLELTLSYESMAAYELRFLALLSPVPLKCK